jgi:hypothetical protein
MTSTSQNEHTTQAWRYHERSEVNSWQWLHMGALTHRRFTTCCAGVSWNPLSMFRRVVGSGR